MEFLIQIGFGVLLIIIIIFLYCKNKSLKDLLTSKSTDITNKELENVKLSTQLESINKQNKDSQGYLKTEFKSLAQELLKTNQEELSQTSVKTLTEVLTPMRTELKEFKSKVEAAHQTDIETSATFKQQFEYLKQSNQQITKEASHLTKALKGEKQKQGAWGEVILARVLEASGLQQGREFEIQKHLTDSDNKPYRPDAVIYLPGGRQIIVDAKTSLNSYKEAINSEDEAQSGQYLQQHVKNIESHIKDLSEKKYQYLQEINSLDFVLMFIPIEGALLMALNNKPELYDNAFKQNIVLVSPSTLQLALRTVEATWRYKKQQENIQQVAERASKMYDKFAGFVEDMEKVGKNLNRAEAEHQNALNKLKSGRGNLIFQAESLKQIAGIKPNKTLPNPE